jgi:hypothetical protein
MACFVCGGTTNMSSSSTDPPVITIASALKDPNVFPETRLKAQLRRYPSFGRVVVGTLKSVRVSSALLVRGLVEGILNSSAAAEAKNDAATAHPATSVVRLVDVQELIRQHAQDYHFVKGRIHKLSDSDAVVKTSSKRRKPNPPQASKTHRKSLEVPLEEALALTEKQKPFSNSDDNAIVPDDDDYD